MAKPTLHRAGTIYDVMGKTGILAGLLARVSKRRGWMVQMFGCPKEHYTRFTDARKSALEQAKRY